MLKGLVDESNRLAVKRQSSSNPDPEGTIIEGVSWDDSWMIDKKWQEKN
jgi:hypothetical protein